MPQLHSDDDDLRATFYCKDPDSNHGEDCDTFYRTDRGTWVVQGRSRGETVAAQLVALAEDETFLEVREATVELFVRKYVEERYGINLTSAAKRTDLEV